MSKQLGLVSFVATVALTFSATVAVPQGMTGVIQGTVSDEEGGAPLPDATIRLVDDTRGRQFSTKSDKNGRFYKRGLPGANYLATIEKEGYKQLQEQLRVASGGESRFDFKLAKAAPPGAREFAEGFAAFNAGDNEGAARAFEAAVEKAPDLPEIRVNLALAYLRLSRNEEAVTQLEKAATLAPEDARTLFRLGGAYVEMAEYDKAIVVLEKGLAIESDLNNELAAETTVTLGAVYFAKGQIEKSVAQFEKVLAVTPGAPVASLGLAKAYLSLDNRDKALELLEHVVSVAPGTPEAERAEVFLAELRRDATQQP